MCTHLFFFPFLHCPSVSLNSFLNFFVFPSLLSFSDPKTLNWTCACKVETRSTFGDWQLPVPFQLCRRQLSSCLLQCESSQRHNFKRERKAGLSSPPLMKREKNGSGRDDNEQEQGTEGMDIVDEFQLFRHSARLQATSFSKYRKHQQQQRQHQLRHSVKSKQQKRRKSTHVGKKRALEHQVNTRIQQHQALKSKAGGAATREDTTTREAGASVTVTKGKDEVIVQPPSAYSLDSPVPRDPVCAAQCEHQFSCGTPSAPEYHNLNDYLTSNNSRNSNSSTLGDGGGKAVSRNKSNGPDSGGLFELRLSMLASLVVVATSVIMACHVTL